MKALPKVMVLALFELSGGLPRHLESRFAAAHLASPSEAEAQTLPGVYTHRYDNNRSGVNRSERLLKPSLVNQTTFGLLFSDNVDGPVFAEPLYVPALNIGGQIHNVVYVATEHDSVYAFDADHQGPRLSQTSLLAPGEQTLSTQDTNCKDIAPEVGVTSTPVIDQVAGTLYVLARSKLPTPSGVQYFARLHALNIANLKSERPGFPVVVSASVPGNGGGAIGGFVTFDPQRQGQRAALLLAQNGGAGRQVYVAFASLCDRGPFHGWVFEYDAATGQQLGVFNTAPNGHAGGIWETGNGLAEDANGAIYAAVGNGDYNPAVGDYGDSLVKLTPAAPGSDQLTVADFYTPSYNCALQANDFDFGDGGVELLPDQATSPTHLVIAEDKNGTIYLLNRDNLGGGPPPVTCPSSVPRPTAPPPECADSPLIPECFFDINPSPSYLFSAPIFFNGNLHVIPFQSPPEIFAMNDDGVFSTSPAAAVPPSQFVVSPHGPGMTISASGVNNALLWIYDDANYSQQGLALLYAFDPNNLSGPVYASNQLPGRDNPGGTLKFAVPTEINGKVYLGTASTLAVYGLLTTSPAKPITLHGAQSVAADGVTAVSLTKPAGARAGDLLIAQIAALDSVGAQIPFRAPAGWKLISAGSSTTGDQTQAIFEKIAGTAEPSSYTWTSSTPVSAAGGIAAYGNVNTASPIDNSSSVFFATPDTTITAQSITTQHEHEQLIVLISTFVGENSSSWTIAPGMTNEWLAEDTNANVSALLLDQLLGVAGPTGSRTAKIQTAAPAAVVALAIRSVGN